MPLIEDLSRYGIEDCSYSPEAQKSNAYSSPVTVLYSIFNVAGINSQNICMGIKITHILAHISKKIMSRTFEREPVKKVLSNYNENNCLRVQNCRELLGKIKGKIVFQWVPSHCGLWGNERADFLAKKGTGILQNFCRDLTLHSAKLEIKGFLGESFRLKASRVARDKPWSTLLTSPICVLCDTGQDMTAAHLDECSALNDLNCIVKKVLESPLPNDLMVNGLAFVK
ncbi:hypothetical protein TNCV_4247051 [Trichonephila clavipes]|nr:hypothetical protein TNCV_4247051 [Trichonephila clavipes]